MKKFWTLAFLLISIAAFAQPMNDDCDGITDLGEAPFCPDDVFFTNVDATPSDIGNFNVPTLGNCDGLGPMENDVWFSFIASDTIEDYTITVTGMDDGTGSTPLGQPQIVLYRGDCELNGLEPVDCNAADVDENIVNLDVSGLDAGLPYYIRISDWNATGGNQEGTFLLCVREADPIIILDEDVTTDLCEGEVYDSGGEGDDYQPNENYTLTITPPQPVSCITFNLEYFNIDNSGDAITFYDGASTASPIISTISGANFSDEGGGGVCYQVQATSGALTMTFQTDGNVELDGFYGYWECSSQPCEPFELVNVSTDIDDQTIINNLATPLTTVTIDTIDCPEMSIGVFDGGDLTDLGLEKGLVLSSGAIENDGFQVGVSNPGATFASSFTGGGGDDDLDYLSLQGNGALSNDACVIEMDVFVATNELRFEYVFGSEEYPEYVNSTFNDIFAFLISGPGIVGDPNIANQENIAVLPPPNNSLVEINSVNNLVNWEYYRNNADGPSVVYDGLTSDFLGIKKSLTAIAEVVPCTTYHLKMAIADRGDTAFDSGVFISELKGGTPTLDITYNNGIDYLVEDCTDEEDLIVLELPIEIDEPQTYEILIEGTATPGVDYILNLPPTITFNPGDTEFSFPIQPITDGIIEGIETIEISLISNFGCGDVAFTTLTIEIHDDLNVEIFAGADTAFVCQGNSIQMEVIGAVDYTWISQEPGIFTPSNDIPDPTATPTFDQEVYVLGQLGVCSDVDTVFLDVVDPEVSIVAVGETEFCQGDSVVLVAQNNVGNSGVIWSPDVGLNDPELATVVATPLTNTTYTVTVQLEGCSASDQITVSVDPFDFPTLGADTTICENYSVELATEIPFTTTTYSWTPIDGLDDPTASNPIATPDETTTYTVTATSENGFCDLSDDITVEVIPADIEIVEPIPDTLEICLGESVNLTALTTTQGVGFTWGPDDGTIFPDLLDTAVVATPTISTTYFATLEVGACLVFDSVFVRVDSLPENEITQVVPDQETYCEGDLITLISPTYDPVFYPDIEHEWTPMIGLQTPDSLWNLVFQATQSATYFRVTTNNACVDTAQIDIEVISVSSLTLNPDMAAICEGDSIQLTAISQDMIEEIEWTNAGSLSCDDCLNPVATPTGNTTYQVSGMFMDCPVTSNPATISVVSLPDPMLPSDVSICVDSTVILYEGNVDPNATYTWSSGGTVISNNPTEVFSPNVTTTYTLVIENGDCVEEYESTINVLSQPPTATIIEDQLICAGQSVVLSIESNPPNEVWAWFDSNGNLVGSGSTIEISPGQSDQFTAVGDFSCYQLSESVFVDVSNGFTVDSIVVIPDGIIYEGSTITLEAFTTPGTLLNPMYTWSFNGEPLEDSNFNPLEIQAPPAINGETTALNASVEIIDDIGCSTTASLPLTIEPSEFEIPNIFTPDGDDINDRFAVLKNEAISIVEFQVFNRWGQMVYNNESGDLGWDGRHNGELAPSDVYAYRIVLQRGTGELEPLEGEITLVR